MAPAGSPGHLLADERVALLLELVGQLGAALTDDPPVEHDVDEVRAHVAEDARVVRDDQEAALVVAHRVDAVGYDPQSVDVEPRVGLVEHREGGLEHRQLQDLRALLLAAREALVEVALGEVAADLEQIDVLAQQSAELLELDRLL